MPQPVHRRVQLALDRALGEAERVGDLPELQPLMVPHHEHDPLAGSRPISASSTCPSSPA